MGGFLGFLFILLLVVIILPLMRIVIAAYNLRRRFKKAAEGFRGRQETNGNTNDRSQQNREKVFTKDIGEYVAFEEIAVEEEEDTRRRTSNSSYNNVKVESQITDVEFEELK